MLDLKFIREHPDVVREGARKKRIDVDLDALLELDARLRRLQARADEIRTELNRRQKGLAALPPEERRRVGRESEPLKEELRAIEEEIRTLRPRFQDLWLRVPNVPDPDVPEGETDAENVEIRRVGEPTRFDFEPLDHVELGRRLGLIDIERGVKVAGSRNYFLTGEGARLERAVLNLAMDLMIERGYVPLSVPVLVKRDAMVGTAYFPGGEDQAYHCERDDLFLVGTAEVPVTSFHADEILKREELPKRYVAWSYCFRREAGAAGKDTRGLYRIHQFQKVEQVVLCENDVELSRRLHQEILENAEAVLQRLELPYRVVDVCGGDLGAPQVRKYDIETWMPSRNGWGETHSASRFHDYQARRLRIRYKDERKKTRFVHTLNNTVVASPRILIPLLECHQQADGSVRIPEALRPYLGGKERLETR